MQIFLNGEVREVEAEMSLSKLLSVFELPEKRIAVELNKEVVRRSDWANTTIGSDDKIEVIHFVGGG